MTFADNRILMLVLNSSVLAALLLLPVPALADCTPIGQQVSTSRFVVSGDEVHDKSTKLGWSRCPVGMHFQEGRCVGTATLMTLPEAEEHARTLGKDWRLASVDELLSIVEPRCNNPAIDTALFPGASELFEGQSKYWSSTPSDVMPGLMYNVDFTDGTVDANSEGIPMGVRFVRTLP